MKLKLKDQYGKYFKERKYVFLLGLAIGFIFGLLMIGSLLALLICVILANFMVLFLILQNLKGSTKPPIKTKPKSEPDKTKEKRNTENTNKQSKEKHIHIHIGEDKE